MSKIFIRARWSNPFKWRRRGKGGEEEMGIQLDGTAAI
jgi:hypothetical protein